MIKIIHTNDMHGKIESSLNSPGIDRFAHAINKIRKSFNTILLDAGDTFHGSPEALKSKGKIMVDIMNEMGYDAMVPGNHDFNYGLDRLVELSEMAKFSVISANIYNLDGKRVFKPYILKEIGGIKVGIFGITTPETYYKSRPEDIVGLEFRNPIEEARKVSAELRSEGKANIVVALVHLGLDKSTREDYRSDTLAREVEGIDIVVDGHSHTVLEKGMVEEKTLISQAGSYMEHMGMISIDTELSGAASFSSEIISGKSLKNCGEDIKIKTIVEDMKRESGALETELLGKSDHYLVGDRYSVRTKETNLGWLLAGAMKYITGAEIAITNGGGIRQSIEAGWITRKDVSLAFPFGNYIVTKEIKGKDILEAIEHGVSKYPEPNSGFPHVDGIAFKVDYSREAGNRVRELTFKGKAIEMEREYRIATNDFLACGGDDYYMLKKAPLTGRYPSIDEVISSYIAELGVSGEGLDIAEAI